MNDDLLFFADDPVESNKHRQEDATSTPPWTLLVVDDDESILMVTKLALKKFEVDDRPTRIITADSMSAAKQYLQENDSVAVVIADVVMETERAGLELVSWIREQSEFDPMRLVIRTGQPGSAPPEQVIGELDINDYWPKTEVTPHRMRTIITGLVRSYRDIQLLNSQKKLLKDMQAKLFETERLKVLGELASGVAHDFNNALTPISGYASMLLTIPDLSDEEKLEFTQIIADAAKDATTIVKRLQQNYSGMGQNSEHEDFPVASLLSGAAALAKTRVDRRAADFGGHINIAVDYSGDDALFCNAGEMRQALLNLIINAADAMTESGTIEVAAAVEPSEVRLSVKDTGTGMSPETVAKCREAFFTTKGEKGSGLGIATVIHTIEQHSGRVDIESTLGIGTTVSIVVPRNSAS